MSGENIKAGIRKHAWKVDAKRADKYIKYCPKCKRCYEQMFRHTWQQLTIVYLENFPSYGKEKLICDDCVKKSALASSNAKKGG